MTLPEPAFFIECNDEPKLPVFTADQMRAAVLQEREACAKACEDRSKWVANVVFPSLPVAFRGADSFANGALQEAEVCAKTIRERSALSSGG